MRQVREATSSGWKAKVREREQRTDSAAASGQQKVKVSEREGE